MIAIHRERDKLLQQSCALTQQRQLTNDLVVLLLQPSSPLTGEVDDKANVFLTAAAAIASQVKKGFRLQNSNNQKQGMQIPCTIVALISNNIGHGKRIVVIHHLIIGSLHV